MGLGRKAPSSIVGRCGWVPGSVAGAAGGRGGPHCQHLHLIRVACPECPVQRLADQLGELFYCIVLSWKSSRAGNFRIVDKNERGREGGCRRHQDSSQCGCVPAACRSVLVVCTHGGCSGCAEPLTGMLGLAADSTSTALYQLPSAPLGRLHAPCPSPHPVPCTCPGGPLQAGGTPGAHPRRRAAQSPPGCTSAPPGTRCAPAAPAPSSPAQVWKEGHKGSERKVGRRAQAARRCAGAPGLHRAASGGASSAAPSGASGASAA